MISMGTSYRLARYSVGGDKRLDSDVYSGCFHVLLETHLWSVCTCLRLEIPHSQQPTGLVVGEMARPFHGFNTVLVPEYKAKPSPQAVFCPYGFIDAVFHARRPVSKQGKAPRTSAAAVKGVHPAPWGMGRRVSNVSRGFELWDDGFARLGRSFANAKKAKDGPPYHPNAESALQPNTKQTDRSRRNLHLAVQGLEAAVEVFIVVAPRVVSLGHLQPIPLALIVRIFKIGRPWLVVRVRFPLLAIDKAVAQAVQKLVG